MTKYVIQTMTRQDLDLAIAWAAAEGWNPGLNDADCFYAADPSGFLMGYLNGEPIAAISAVKYGTSFGFLGFYIVKPEFRGQGYGLQIWQAALAALQGRIIGLDGVVSQQSNYLKSGFQFAYRNVRYEGRGAEGARERSPSLLPLNAVARADLIAYDAAFFPDERSQFLKCWVSQPQSYAVASVDDGQLVGYGLLRPCQQGYKIGPLLADSSAIAENIFCDLKAQVPVEQPFYLDVPEVNAAAIALAEQYGMQVMFETARMYMPTIPPLPTDQIFGVTSFELG